MDRLGHWAVERSLAPIALAEEWTKAGESFGDAVVRHANAVNESRWMDALCAERRGLHPVALPENYRPIASACSSGTYIVLESDPVIVCALVDPLPAEQQLQRIAGDFSGRDVRFCAVTPHAMSRLQTRQMAGDARPSEWFETDLDLAFENRRLWLSEPPVPCLHDGSIDRALFCDAVEGLIYFKTALHVFVATPHLPGEEIRSRILQATGLLPLFARISPEEFHRVRRDADGAAKPAEITLQPHEEAWDSVEATALLREMLASAIDRRASDIHLDPKEDRVRVRFRIDGELYEQPPLAKTGYGDLMRRIKIQGGMLQSVSGRIQDGSGWLLHGPRRYDLRFSVTVLTGEDEAAVIRIFHSEVQSLADLRIPPSELRTFQWFAGLETGLCILSGPTGSGKTTTLYALLRELAAPSRSLVTIEQPVEKHFAEAKQISVYSEGERTFAAALRSVLRQDPDVIMIGEIRDPESCAIAVQASLTGHQVLTTTHANDAAGVITRLTGSFEVDRVALAYALRLSVAQRLLPRLCGFCKTQRELQTHEAETLGCTLGNPTHVAERGSCGACKGTGYSGRLLIAELLPVDSTMEAMIMEGEPPAAIAAHNRSLGFHSLADQAAGLLLSGEIDLPTARLFSPNHR